MKRNYILSIFIIITAIGSVFLLESCTRVNLYNSSDSNNTNNTIVRLYLGLSSDYKQQKIEMIDVEKILRNHFDGATLQKATGIYKGGKENSVIITIINCCRWEEPEEDFLENIKSLVRELKHELSQESILVEHTSSSSTQVFEILE